MTERFRECATDAPRDVGLILSFAPVPALEGFPEEAWGDPALILVGEFRGDDEPAEVLSPVQEGGSTIADFSSPSTHEDVQQIFDTDYPDGMRYYWKSIFLSEVTDEVINPVIRANQSAPSKLSTIDLWFLGGTVADGPQDETAFWHRDKPFMLNFEANWEYPADDEANVEWGSVVRSLRSSRWPSPRDDIATSRDSRRILSTYCSAITTTGWST